MYRLLGASKVARPMALGDWITLIRVALIRFPNVPACRSLPTRRDGHVGDWEIVIGLHKLRSSVVLLQSVDWHWAARVLSSGDAAPRKLL